MRACICTIGFLCLLSLCASTHATDMHVQSQKLGKEVGELLTSSLRGNVLSNWAADAHNADSEEGEYDDDDDSDDDDLSSDDDADDEKLAVVLTKPAPAASAVPSMPSGLVAPIKMHAQASRVASEKADTKQKEDPEEVKDKLKALRDQEGFNTNVDGAVEKMANETGSPAMATFLGDLRKEMRDYAKTNYEADLVSRLATAEGRVKDLEKDKAATAKKKSDEEEADVHQTHSTVWAMSFFSNVVILALIFAMTQVKSNNIRNYTWFIIDQVIAVFLAVMYFQAFNAFIDFHAIIGHYEVLCSILHAVTLFSAVLFTLYKLQKTPTALAILGGCAAHVVSFASIDAATDAQNFTVGVSYTWLACILGLIAVALCLALIGVLVYTAKRKAKVLQQDAFMDGSDDVENDAGAMAFSVVFTCLVRFLITGHHPTSDESQEAAHDQTDRLFMLLWMFIALALAGVCNKVCAQKAAGTDSYAVKRVMRFITTVSTMNVAWAFLFWGEWQFFVGREHDKEHAGRVTFAIFSTVICGIALCLLTKLPSTSQGSAGQLSTARSFSQQRLVALTALGLVIAWSWELCFDAAVEDMVGEGAHPAAEKVLLTIVMFAIIVPIYAYYVKPISQPAVEAIEG